MPTGRAPFCLAALAGIAAAGALEAGQLACRFELVCVEGSMCVETDRGARLEPAEPPQAVLHLEAGAVDGALERIGSTLLFEGTAEADRLRLLFGVGADGAARLMAMETEPLRIAVYLGRCEEF